MLKPVIKGLGVCALFAGLAAAQEADYGISVPVTASFGAMDTQRFQLFNPSANTRVADFRLMLYPTIRLGKHWFGYAAVQVRRLPYFYYDAFLTDRGVQTQTIEGYVGYTRHVGAATMVVKAGQMTTAFGAFPLRYDDAENPVMDQPLSYITEVPLRTDQLLCGTVDLQHQFYGSVGASCGGALGRGPGLTPVTLYGQPGVQGEVSVHRFDGRVQLAANSPAYPDGLHISRQYLQWAAGGGFTISQGFRLGMSGFRGPYLSSEVSPYLPAGTTVRSFPASGIGLDGQWARGRLSVKGEWQRLRFDAPNFVVAPSVSSGYVEVKGRLTPRLFAAVRDGYLKTGSVLDTKGVSISQFAPTLRQTEFGVGCWIQPRLLFKVSYERMQSAGSSGTRFNVLGVQLVAQFRQAQWAWK